MEPPSSRSAPRTRTPALSVVLSTIAHDDQFPVRRFVLDESRSTMQIGRASVRHVERGQPQANNGTFVSAVVSRTHALLQLTDDCKTLTITDLNSLHGTALNGSKLAPNLPVPVSNNDIIMIGANVQQGNRNHAARHLKVVTRYIEPPEVHEVVNVCTPPPPQSFSQPSTQREKIVIDLSSPIQRAVSVESDISTNLSPLDRRIATCSAPSTDSAPFAKAVLSSSSASQSDSHVNSAADSDDVIVVESPPSSLLYCSSNPSHKKSGEPLPHCPTAMETLFLAADAAERATPSRVYSMPLDSESDYGDLSDDGLAEVAVEQRVNERLGTDAVDRQSPKTIGMPAISSAGIPSRTSIASILNHDADTSSEDQDDDDKSVDSLDDVSNDGDACGAAEIADQGSDDSGPDCSDRDAEDCSNESADELLSRAGSSNSSQASVRISEASEASGYDKCQSPGSPEMATIQSPELGPRKIPLSEDTAHSQPQYDAELGERGANTLKAVLLEDVTSKLGYFTTQEAPPPAGRDQSTPLPMAHDTYRHPFSNHHGNATSQYLRSAGMEIRDSPFYPVHKASSAYSQTPMSAHSGLEHHPLSVLYENTRPEHLRSDVREKSTVDPRVIDKDSSSTNGYNSQMRKQFSIPDLEGHNKVPAMSKTSLKRDHNTFLDDAKARNEWDVPRKVATDSTIPRNSELPLSSEPTKDAPAENAVIASQISESRSFDNGEPQHKKVCVESSLRSSVKPFLLGALAGSIGLFTAFAALPDIA